ncbi:MAG: hypothetical protein LBH40_01830 [Alphaproteobacteria bacterium]|nr:hypothetical protein [Alphaproteobacteria bacterium]
MLANKLNEEDVEQYKKLYVELLKLELSDMDLTNTSVLDDLYEGLQETPEGFPDELVEWHKNELIHELSKDYKPKDK